MVTLSKNSKVNKLEFHFPLGILFLVLGIAMLGVPICFHTRIDLLLPWIFIIVGIFRLLYGIVTYQTTELSVNITLALLSLSIGIYLLQANTEPLLGFTSIVVLFLLFEGLSKILIASNIQSPWAETLVFFSGVVGLILGTLAWTGILTNVPWLLSAIAGTRIIYIGLSNLAFALKYFE